MNVKLTSVASAVSGILMVALLPEAANAALVTDLQTLSFSDTRNVAATKTGTTGGPASNSASTTPWSAGGFDGFNPSLGVLKQVNVNTPTGVRTQSVFAQGTGGNGPSKLAQGRQLMTGLNLGVGGQIKSVSNIQSYAPGPTQTTFVTCSAAGTANCTSATAAGFNTGNATLTAPWNPIANDAFIGAAGTVAATTAFTSTTAAGNPNSPGFASVTATGTANWSGSITLDYGYVLHSSPALSGSNVSNNTLDFGTWLVNGSNTPDTKQYDVLNRDVTGGDPSNQNALTLVEVQPVSGTDTDVLTTDAAPFTNLAAGETNTFTAGFVPTTVGHFSAEYLLNFADSTPFDAAPPNSSYYSFLTPGAGSDFQVNLTILGTAKAAAAPSFANPDQILETSLSFGTIQPGDNSSLPFSIYNLLDGLAASDRVGLQFQGCSSSGDVGLFGVDLCGLASGSLNILAGEKYDGNALFNPAGYTGLAEAVYNFSFLDYEAGLNGTPNEYTMTLNLTGTAVPVPAAVWLFGSALAGLGLIRRRAA